MLKSVTDLQVLHIVMVLPTFAFSHQTDILSHISDFIFHISHFTFDLVETKNGDL